MMLPFSSPMPLTIPSLYIEICLRFHTCRRLSRLYTHGSRPCTAGSLGYVTLTTAECGSRLWDVACGEMRTLYIHLRTSCLLIAQLPIYVRLYSATQTPLIVMNIILPPLPRMLLVCSSYRPKYTPKEFYPSKVCFSFPSTATSLHPSRPHSSLSSYS